MICDNRHLSSSVRAAAEAVAAARGQAERVARVFHRSPMPMVIVDQERRYVDVNHPARLMLRLPLAKLLTLRLGDLTPPSRRCEMDGKWARLIEDGRTTGPHTVAVPGGGCFEVVYYGLANALPDLHVIAFAPAAWSAAELDHLAMNGESAFVGLTPRELEVLQLAARGFSGPRIAAELVLSPATVKTHFENIYSKLAVTDRAAAVAQALRLGLID